MQGYVIGITETHWFQQTLIIENSDYVDVLNFTEVQCNSIRLVQCIVFNRAAFRGAKAFRGASSNLSAFTSGHALDVSFSTVFLSRLLEPTDKNQLFAERPSVKFR